MNNLINKNNTSISIVTPCWNSVKYLQEVYNSLNLQTLTNWEWIVIDDDSNDGSYELLQKIASTDKRVKPLKNKHTGLPAVGRNIGMRLSQGKYIAFLDSDDIFMPDKLEKQYKLLEENKSIGLTYSFVEEFITSESEIIGDPPTVWPKVKLPGKAFNNILMNGNSICTSSIIIRREVYELIGNFEEIEDLKAMEDHEYLLRIAEKFEIRRTDGILVRYRIHPQNISKNLNINKFEALKQCLEKRGYLNSYAGKVFLSGYYMILAEYSMVGILKDTPMRINFLKAIILNPTNFKRWIGILSFIMPKRFFKFFYLKIKSYQISFGKNKIHSHPFVQRRI